ncbi:YigZ family protein [Pseudomonas sp. sia0905]|uniref:IMPACT family protein n=1 Tax=Pseudomonas sp. sia0905 TaxID=2854783 RepID=UPI001C4566C3|nr:YigZ family protein [Pseudomonas sp. sia0905]MBV7565084.1 IMPACT family protein [Pseudomonas sp. sia0905]
MPYLLLAPCDYREDIRKSRFLAQARAISSAADAQAFIDEVSDPAASHNCWAWKLGQQYRFSDDGEPGGTAGRPILAAIEGQGFDAVAVVVTRWYGGIQLGTGGLARAYGGSANKCLQNAERQEQVPRTACVCHCGFAELALLKSRLAEFDAVLEQESFDAEGAELQLAVPQAQIEGLQRLLADISRGRSTLRIIE